MGIITLWVFIATAFSKGLQYSASSVFQLSFKEGQLKKAENNKKTQFRKVAHHRHFAENLSKV